MSDAMENRAAVFTSSPQDVEVYRSGGWQPGSMLGWRHERDGSCRAWVRLAAGGADDTAWIDLADVRLPEPAGLRSSEDTLVPVAPRRAAAGRGRSQDADGSAPSELTATMNLFAVRDVAAAAEDDRRPGAPAAGGRRRATEVDDVASAAAYWAAFDAARGGTEPAASPGRHRAPAAVAAGAGRHRAADTEVMAAVGADGALPARNDRRAVPAKPPTFPRSAACDEPGADLYTRPMRLTAVPQQRTGGGRDGSRGGF